MNDFSWFFSKSLIWRFFLSSSSCISTFKIKIIWLLLILNLNRHSIKLIFINIFPLIILFSCRIHRFTSNKFFYFIFIFLLHLLLCFFLLQLMFTYAIISLFSLLRCAIQNNHFHLFWRLLHFFQYLYLFSLIRILNAQPFIGKLLHPLCETPPLFLLQFLDCK